MLEKKVTFSAPPFHVPVMTIFRRHNENSPWIFRLPVGLEFTQEMVELLLEEFKKVNEEFPRK